MAKGQGTNLTENQNSNGERPKAKDEMKDRRGDSRPSQPAHIPGSCHDGNAAEKLSEAVGGISVDDEGDESNRWWGSDDVDYQGIDTKSGCFFPSPRVYRSLSEISLNDKKSAIWCQHELEPVGASYIRLGDTASFVQPLESKQTKVAISGSRSTEDQSYSRCLPLNINSKKEYRRIFYDVSKENKTRHQKRMMLRIESGCSSSNNCFHPEQKHDWISHDAKKMQIYNYATSRTGHIFKRERNTNMFEEAGTCCHIGDGYVLTCYHCINVLWKDESWQNEKLLQEDLAVTFPEVGPHPSSRTLLYSFESSLLAFCEDLDYAVLKLDLRNSKQIPPHFSAHTNETGGQEHPVYVAGYQLHPKHTYGKVVVDATALKLPLQALNLEVVEGWNKVHNNNFEMCIKRLYDGMDPWKSTYYPLRRCGQNFPVLTSLISGASGGFGLTYTAKDESPVVNFLYRAGYPSFYYNSMFASTSNLDHQAILNGFSPCWTFQEGVPIGAIVKDIRKFPDPSLNAIPFLRQNV